MSNEHYNEPEYDVHTTYVEYDMDGFVDEERGGYGASIVGEVRYIIKDVDRADTPLGVIKGHAIEFFDSECTIFVSDQDGGELYSHDCCISEYLSDEAILDEIERGMK